MAAPDKVDKAFTKAVRVFSITCVASLELVPSPVPINGSVSAKACAPYAIFKELSAEAALVWSWSICAWEIVIKTAYLN
ncbi:hypothetical protein PEV8663_03081 [Pelagimonas varians]|uniref:Uncharacterized protein n=1 Tax=Pelagimonas varians TaxID=696760 RepID=A0A238KUD0_9RHOB|nr:hypothetical protein PEV8663_03081 [Pelagimonas varians]